MKPPKVMLHIIMPNQISGPNNAAARIAQSHLADRYEFVYVTQKFHAGGRVNFSLIRDLRAQIRAEKPDLIHLSGLLSSGFHAVIAARLSTRAPILIAIRGFASDALQSFKFKRFVFDWFVEPLSLALSTKFLTVTHEAGDRHIVRRFRRKYLGALHNAAPSWPAGRLDGSELKKERERLGLPGGFIAAVVGRMVSDKGIETVVEVAARLPSGMSICLVGDGPWYARIEAQYPELISSQRIILLGQRSNVREILAVSDAFLFATLYENLSNALLEAMSLSLPTVVTNVGGNPEVVRDGETGYLVEPGDVEAMVSCLLKLKEDPARARRMGFAGRKRIETFFSSEHIYGSLEKLYEKMLSGCKGKFCP